MIRYLSPRGDKYVHIHIFVSRSKMIFFFPFLILLVPALSSLKQLNCYSGRDFAVELLNGSKAHVYGAEVNLLFSRNKVHIYTYPDRDAVNILINDTIIILKGNLSVGNLITPPQKIYQVIHLQAKGLGKLKKYNNNTKLSNCQIHTVRNENDSLVIPREVEKEFRKSISNCIGYQICSKIGTVQPEDYSTSRYPYELGSLFVYSTKLYKHSVFENLSPSNARNNKTEVAAELQSYINTIVDLVLAEVIYQIKKRHEESVKIPAISQEFSFGSGIFKTTGHFDATNGNFRDLTTLSRSTDATLERNALKFSISCGFGLSTARIEYDNYKLKFGIIKVSGTISANIDGIFIDTKFSVDYNQYPCKAKLEYLKNTQLGRLDVEITGLAPLNSLASYLATLIATKWEGDIAGLLETKVSEVLTYELDNFNCEKYRLFT